MSEDSSSPETRRDRLWAAAESRNIPLGTILTGAAVVVLVYLTGKLVYRLRDVILIMVVAGFVALILNPLVVVLQRWHLRRRGWAVAVVTIWASAILVRAGSGVRISLGQRAHPPS